VAGFASPRLAQAHGMQMVEAAAVFIAGRTSVVQPGNPCIETQIFLTAQEWHGSDAESRLSLLVEEYDMCAPVPNTRIAIFYTGVVALAPNDFNVSRKLHRARLDTTVVACETSQPDFCLTLDVSLNWATDGLPGGRPTEGLVLVRGTASGTFSDGSRNLAPGPSLTAYLQLRHLT
jgi:hypothetical protein